MEVKARAPGKIILAGEHAVVHGSTAVAASIGLYTYVSLQVSPSNENDDRLILQLKDTSLEFSWPIGRIKEALSSLGGPFPSTPMSCSSETFNLILAMIEEQNIPEAKTSLASGVSAFLWLYTSILGFKPATVVVTSDLPLGAGLGSSAALCVAFSAALLACSDTVNMDMKQEGWSVFGESELELLNKWAFAGEKIIHGKPSGIDNTVSTYGNMIKFSKELANVIQTPAPDDQSIIAKEEKLEELMEMNQGLLQCMGVSHASIETVLRTTLKYKLVSKLTGAGGGGCVLTLLPTLLSGTIVDKVIAELESCGFQCLIAGIGGNGAEICFSASS
ncbi:MEVALONATE KINASE [Salix purpurea]|uniref:mevalonate kinase n=1 Tax=Salix purpurea TaxID=77065 RepID=A0A9Q0W8R6_SALPP|nr:MEVALONATE KINASE [Salix purpurea]